MKSKFTFIQPLTRRIILLLFVAVASNLKAQDLYDINTIQTIRTSFSKTIGIICWIQQPPEVTFTS